MWGQLSATCSNVTEVAQLGSPSCSRPQPATDNGVRDGRSNWLVVTPHPSQSANSWAPRIALWKFGIQITRLAAATGTRTQDLGLPGQRTACAATLGVTKAPGYYTLSSRIGKVVASRTQGCLVDSRQGVLPMRMGGATSQLDLPSLTPLSIAGWGRLQLGDPIGLLP